MKAKKIEMLRNMADTFGKIVVTRETAKKVGVSRKEAYALAHGMGVGVIAAMSVLEGDSDDIDALVYMYAMTLENYPEIRDKILNDVKETFDE